MVFISYARADQPRVTPLADALTARGYDVWWDALIEGGAGFAKAIEAKLEVADAVVVVWSATSVASDWVRDEAAHARDRKRIVPVTIDGTEAPMGFRQYHTIDLSRWKGRADAPEMAGLIAGIEGVGKGAPVAAIGRSPARGIDRRTALIAGGGAVAAVAGGLAVFRPWESGRLANSVAVLPFANLSEDKDQAYFSDGLSEEIRSALARNPALKVAAPTSANTFRDKAADAKVIGARLGVAFLLEGSVRRAGNVVRIAAELVDAQTGFSKWSQSFDRQLTDVFAVQSEIASVVVDALAVRVAGVAKAIGGTTNVAAYDAYLKGKAAFNADAGEASDRQALAYFDAAVAADPNFAAAHAARSRAIVSIANQYAAAKDLRVLYHDAEETAKNAIRLAPDLAAGHLALGRVFSAQNDVARARLSFDRASQLGAGDADIQQVYAVFSARSGNPAKAIAAATRAMDLDRLNPLAFRSGGLVQYLANNYQLAIALLQHALSLDPKLRNAHGNIGNCQFMLNRLGDARSSYAFEPAAILRLPGVAIAERRLGNIVASRAAMTQLISELGDGALYQQAQVLTQWGQAEQAIGALEKAKKIGDSGILQASVDPLLAPLRADFRFRRLIGPN